jgi:hypothetical protein
MRLIENQSRLKSMSEKEEGRRCKCPAAQSSKKSNALVFDNALLLEMLQLSNNPNRPDTTVSPAIAVNCVFNNCLFQTCAPTTTATPPPCTCVDSITRGNTRESVQRRSYKSSIGGAS